MRNKLLFFWLILFLGNGCATLPNPSMTAIQNAEHLVEQNQSAQAEQLLEQYRKTWKTQAIQGDIAAYRGQWQKAAQFFKESLNLAETAHPEPAYSEKDRIYSSFEEAQLLAGKTVSALIEPPHDPVKSWYVPKKMRIAVEFESDGWKVDDITQEGKEAIERMANYLHNKRKAAIIGHTDERGKASYNQRLSEQRAKSIHQYLRNKGTQTKITTEGKGEAEPLRPLPRWKRNWTQAEIYQRDRRVELVIE